MYSAGIPVRDMMKETQAKFPERRDQLLELLQIDLDWMMNEVIEACAYALVVLTCCLVVGWHAPSSTDFPAAARSIQGALHECFAGLS